MSRALTTTAVTLAVLIFGTACDEPTPTPSPTVVQEDDPGWDCRTMGNRICGPTKGA